MNENNQDLLTRIENAINGVIEEERRKIKARIFPTEQDSQDLATIDTISRNLINELEGLTQSASQPTTADTVEEENPTFNQEETTPGRERFTLFESMVEDLTNEQDQNLENNEGQEDEQLASSIIFPEEQPTPVEQTTDFNILDEITRAVGSTEPEQPDKTSENSLKDMERFFSTPKDLTDEPEKSEESVNDMDNFFTPPAPLDEEFDLEASLKDRTFHQNKITEFQNKKMLLEMLDKNTRSQTADELIELYTSIIDSEQKKLDDINKRINKETTQFMPSVIPPEDNELATIFPEIDITPQQPEEQPKKNEIIAVRKPKKNVKKYIVGKIAAITAGIILLVSGVKKIVNMFPTPDKTSSIKTETITTNDDVLNQVEESIKAGVIDPETLQNPQVKNKDTKTDKTSSIENKSYEETIADVIETARVGVTDLETLNQELNEKTAISPETIYEEENKISIGSTVTINESSKIYNNTTDAYLDENSHNAYFDNKDKRIILGLGVVNENGMNVVYASDKNKDKKIENLLNGGGEIVSVLVANQEKYLQDYNGKDTLMEDEIKAYAEGWYNINDINTQNTKGIHRWKK